MTELNIRTWGTGERTALLVHGLSSSSRTWNAFGPYLVDRGYRVVAVDLRGHGASPRGDYSRERFADDLVDTAGGRPELVVGHSLGAVVLAMAVEELRPQRAVYLDPAWYPWGSEQAYGASQSFFRTLPGTTAAQVSVANPRWSTAAAADRAAEIADWDPATTRMRYLETAAVPVFPLVPSLVVAAGDSVLAPPVIDHLADVGFAVEHVPGAGHFLHLDDPAGTTAAVDGWV